jgi:hypothetical protein
MVAVDRDYADDVAEVARLLADEEALDDVLLRLTALGAELVSGRAAAVVTVVTARPGWRLRRWSQ